MIQKSDAGVKQTPMMQQYFSTKEKHPDDVVFFRMGDFYEMFFEDAEICSQVLGITLTSRSKEKGQKIPMAGIPVKAVDTYLAKLLRAGKRVAICEQVQDPKDAKGIVDREVVRGHLTREQAGVAGESLLAGLGRGTGQLPAGGPALRHAAALGGEPAVLR